MKGNAALDALWAALDEGREPPPPNSITVYDYSKKYGVSRASAQGFLDRAHAAGKLERGRYFVNGHKGKVSHYWLPTGKKKT